MRGLLNSTVMGMTRCSGLTLPTSPQTSREPLETLSRIVREIFEALARWRIGKRHTWWLATAKVAALKGTVKRNEKLLNVNAFRQEAVDLGLFRIILEDRLPARETVGQICSGKFVRLSKSKH